MNPNDTAVFSTPSLIAPSLLGILVWPHLIIIILATAFLALACLFFVFKRRNPTE